MVQSRKKQSVLVNTVNASADTQHKHIGKAMACKISSPSTAAFHARFNHEPAAFMREVVLVASGISVSSVLDDVFGVSSAGGDGFGGRPLRQTTTLSLVRTITSSSSTISIVYSWLDVNILRRMFCPPVLRTWSPSSSFHLCKAW